VTESAEQTFRRLTQALDALSAVQLELDGERLRRRRADALIDRLLGAMSDAVLVTDPRGLIVRVNAAAETLLDRPAADLAEHSPARLFAGEIPKTPWELLERHPKGGAVVETVVVRADGSEVPVSLSYGVIREPSGKITGTVFAARDLADVHRLLHEVEAAEARWRLVAEVSGQLSEEPDPAEVLESVADALAGATRVDIVFVLTVDGVMDEVFASARVRPSPLLSLVGKKAPSGSALDRAVSGGGTVHAESVPENYPLLGVPEIDRALRSAAVVPLVVEPGIVGAAVACSEEDGRVDEQTVEVIEEVAARVALMVSHARARDDLVAARAAQEAGRFRDEILASISHDMKTPLSVLLGLSDMLAEGDVDPARRETYVALDRQVRRLRRLVVQFLDYVRLEAGHDISVVVRPTDVAEVVSRVVATFPESERIQVDLPPGLPLVQADESRLDLALANLLSNALKYALPNTSVRVTAGRKGKNVEISVVDEGPGIPADELPRLFEKFARGQTEGHSEGTGLGLYMTRELMRSQDGDVRASSRRDAGSRFTLVFRAAGDQSGRAHA
jgi:PAS domain S-box-containing protein